MKKKWLSWLLAASMLLVTGCAPADTAPSSEPESSEVVEVESETPSEEETSSEVEVTEEESAKQVIVYFANWNLDGKDADKGGEAASIPWEDVTFVNHAFWEVAPADGTTETTLEWQAAGNAPRTAFMVKSTDPIADYENTEPSVMLEGVAKNHFAQYEALSEQYPDVNIVISIGGWSKCGYFSEMAYTEEGRASFIASCMETLEKYPWLDGFDFDWEYFGGSGEGEGRLPESEDDQGCPIWGTSAEDSENFAKLLSDLREQIEAKYGENGKYLTACASASTGWTLPCQNWEIVHPYLDYVNVMTYDMTGTWEGVAGHNSNIKHVEDAIFALKVGSKIPAEKLCVGSPMYGMDLKLTAASSTADAATGMAIESYRPNGGAEITQEMIGAWAAEAVSGYEILLEDGKATLGESFDNGGTGWHCVYNKFHRSAYLYNDDPDSEYYLWYISYENAYTLQDKLDYVLDEDLGGIIVWESSQDTYDHQLIGQMEDVLS